MSHLTADPTMVALLSSVQELTEICDSTGNTVGFFAPASKWKSDWRVRAAALVDPAEIQRRKTEEKQGRTTREVFEHLKSITEDEPTRTYLQKKIEKLAERDR